MGQSSSQLEPSQLRENQDSNRSNERFLPSDPALEIASPPRRRSNPPADSEQDGEPKTKKVKISPHDATKKERKGRRAMPQHRRGTAILPTEDLIEGSADIVICSDKQSGLGDTAILAQPEAQSARSIHPGTNRGVKSRKRAAQQLKTIENVVDEEEAAGDLIAANSVGDPSPRKKKRRKLTPQITRPKKCMGPADFGELESPMATNGAGDHAQRLIARRADVAVEVAEQNPARKENAPNPANNETSMATYEAEFELKQAMIQEFMQNMQENVEFTTKYEREADPAKRAAMMDKYIVENGLEGVFDLSTAKSDSKSLPGQHSSHDVIRKEVGDTAISRPGPGRKMTRHDGGDRKKKKSRLKPSGPDLATAQAASGARQAGSNRNGTSGGVQPPQTLACEDTEPAADHMPTPPTSFEEKGEQAAKLSQAKEACESEHDEDYNPLEREGYVDASDQITEWLSSQPSPLPLEELSPRIPSPTRVSKKAPARKRAGQRDSDDSDEYRDDEDSEAKATARPSTFKKKRKTSHHKSAKQTAKEIFGEATRSTTNTRGTVMGAWSKEEKTLADSTFASCCHANDIDPYRMKCKVLDWKLLDVLKEEMYEAFPLRSYTAIRKLCQRRFHPYKTGPWTEEEDEILKQQVAALGHKWGDIGEHVGRLAQACKDRWVQVVEHQATLEKGPWSVQEEERLVTAVQDLLEMLKEECKDEDVKNDPELLETMIDWKRVAEALDNTRSAKRCLEKWKVLKSRTTISDESLLQACASKQQQPELSRRQKALEKAYSKLGWQDVMDAISEICEAAEGAAATDFIHETTLWSVISTRNPESRFPPKLRRKCYHAMLEKFGSLPDVQQADGIAAKAFLLKQKIAELEDLGPVDFESTMQKNTSKKKSKKSAPARDAAAIPDAAPGAQRLAGDDQPEIGGQATLGRTGRSTGAGNRKHLSKETIDNSDDDDDDDDDDGVLITEDADIAANETNDAFLTVPAAHSRHEQGQHNYKIEMTRREPKHRCKAGNRKHHQERP